MRGCPALAETESRDGSTRVILVEGPNGGRFPWSNCLLVEGYGKRLLVDSGCGLEALHQLADKLDAVLYTHHHPDHITGHLLLRSVRTLSPSGEEAYHSLEDLAKRFAGSGYSVWLEFARGLLGLEAPPQADEYYKPGEDVCIGGLCVKTLHAPGHLLTHTLVEPVYGHLHLVDIDLSRFGPWYANPEADPHQFLQDVLLIPRLGHERYTSSHKAGIFSRQEAMERLLAFALRIPGAMRQVHEELWRLGEATPSVLSGRGIIYRRYLPGVEELMRLFEVNMLAKLLPWLAGLGCAERVRNGYRARVPPGECSGIDGLEGVIRDAVQP